MKLSKMRTVQCFTVYTYKIEQNGALQFKNNGEKSSIPTSSIHIYPKQPTVWPLSKQMQMYHRLLIELKIDMSQANFRKTNVIPPLYPFMHEHRTIGGGNGSY